MKNIWQQLPRPFVVQAPMEDVTDTVFRQILGETSAPDVYFTEFTNVDGLQSLGRDTVIKRLIYTDAERPIIAQIWGMKPENFYTTAKELIEMGFDGVDINMGCPERSIVKKGACSGLIANHSLAKEIIQATREGLNGVLPLSVKTRLGIQDLQTDAWIGFLLDCSLDALIIHGRTVSEMSSVPCHWEEIGKAVQLRDTKKVSTVIIGNGDVMSYEESKQKAEQYKVDGCMIGRGMFRDLFVFQKTPKKQWSRKERLMLLAKHIQLFQTTWGKTKNFDLMRKFYKVYTLDLPDASELREVLMSYHTPEETLSVLTTLIKQA